MTTLAGFGARPSHMHTCIDSHNALGGVPVTLICAAMRKLKSSLSFSNRDLMVRAMMAQAAHGQFQEWGKGRDRHLVARSVLVQWRVQYMQFAKKEHPAKLSGPFARHL